MLSSKELSLCVDCVEFRPSIPKNNNDDFLACGLYELFVDSNKSTQQRIGGVEILRIVDNQLTSYCSRHSKLNAGVLNLRWLNTDQLICALSDGHLEILNFDASECRLNFDRRLSICSNNDESAIILCVEISRNQQQQQQLFFACGDNQGFVSFGELLKYDDQQKLFHRWSAHSGSEVWTVNFDRIQDSKLILSGGDDCLLKLWDIRGDLNENSQIGTARHDAGVTFVCPFLKNENNTENGSTKIWTGSYDDHLRLWDLRKLKTPEYSLNLGGGVWRIRQRHSTLLCACMYNGWCVLDINDNADKLLTITHADSSNGEKLLYGVDWCPNNKNIIASCTFYDKTVRLSNVLITESL